MPYLGVLNICKLPGMTSHGVVSRVRRLLDMQRIGHAGTLDPMASGVLVTCLGKATRLADYIAGADKAYRAEFLFGVTTASGDAEGDITRRTPADALDEAAIAAVLPRFTGVISQRPPLFSAVQVGGVRAYQLARLGEEMELPAREVTVHAFTPVRFTPGPYPRLLADITCSKGTYIRSLAMDLGEALGVGATLSFLSRTRVGGCRLEDALTLEEVAAAVDAGRLDGVLLPPDRAVEHLPALDWPGSVTDFLHNIPCPTPGEDGLHRAYHEGRFLGLARRMDGQARAVVKTVSV